jgi:hypothetical protein
MQGLGGLWRQEVLEKIGGFDAQSAQILQSETAAFAMQFLEPSQQAFDADKIDAGVLPGVFDEEGGVATAEFHLHWLGLSKQVRQGQRFQDGFQRKDQILRGNDFGVQSGGCQLRIALIS